MSPLLVAIIVLLVLYKLYKFAYDKPPNSPPGIIRLPIGGSYWMLLWGNYKFPFLTIDYYVKKLKSKVISCYFGDFYVVIANDRESIKEVLKREEFDGRVTNAPFIMDRAFGKKLGIFFIEGPEWHEQRRFTLRNMRDFGLGRRHEKYESDFMDESSLFLSILKNGPVYEQEKEIMKGDLMYFPDILYAMSANNIWNIMFGHRFERSQHDVARQLCRSALMFQRANDTTGGAMFQRPILRYFGNMFGYRNHIKGNYAIVDIVKEYLLYQKTTFSDNDERGFVDRYLKKLDDNGLNSFTEEQLVILLVDVMFPAFSAVPVTILHIIKYLMHHPRVMTKVRNEIDNVVGIGRLVTWDDRQNLPYLEAIIRETLRIVSLTPLSVIHKTLKNTTLGGYDIPADTPVFTNLSAMNMDPDMWGDPENFRPERFLDENGQLLKDMSLPFGFGHRLCIGETYARYSMFGIVAHLVQTFNFYFVEGEPSRLEDKLPGLIVSPKDLWLRLESR